MTTQAWTAVADQTTDAGFRTLFSDLVTQILAVGIVQTADTGQVNLATMVRAAANTNAGYLTLRFADSSLYFKLEIGSGQNQNSPRILVTVGTGTNGSGTLTGQLSSASVGCFYNNAPVSTVTNYASRVCHTADAFSLLWKKDFAGAGTLLAGMCIGKSVDGTGAASSLGYGVFTMGAFNDTAWYLQFARTASTAATFTRDNKWTLFPGSPSSSAVQSGNFQSYQLQIPTPDVLPFAWACGVLLTEVGFGTSYTVNMVGAVNHVYTGSGQVNNNAVSTIYSAAGYSISVIYE